MAWLHLLHINPHTTLNSSRVTGSNPVEALIFFRLLLSNCLNWKIYCDDHISLSNLPLGRITKMSRRLEEGQSRLDPLLGDFTSNRELTPVRMNLPGIDLNRSAIDYLIRYVLKNADGKWDYPRSLFLNLDPF